MKSFRFFVAAIIGAGFLSGMGYEGPALMFLLAYALIWPLIAFMNVSWKFYRYFYLPTAVQLWKGFKYIWPAVKRGPVVTRVSRPHSSPTQSP